jgi:lipopolysaccharide export LptBFGC system permease protein LptF
VVTEVVIGMVAVVIGMVAVVIGMVAVVIGMVVAVGVGVLLLLLASIMALGLIDLVIGMVLVNTFVLDGLITIKKILK